MTGQTVIGQNPDGLLIFADDSISVNPFRTSPTPSGITAAQEIDLTTGLQAFQQTSALMQPCCLRSTQAARQPSQAIEGFRSNVEQTLFNRQLGLLQPSSTPAE